MWFSKSQMSVTGNFIATVAGKAIQACFVSAGKLVASLSRGREICLRLAEAETTLYVKGAGSPHLHSSSVAQPLYSSILL